MIKDLLKTQDCEFFKKVTSVNNHPLAPFIPSTENAGSYNLRKKQCPKINTVRFMSAFVNRAKLKTFIIIIQRDPAPRYDGLFLLIGFYPNRTTPFFETESTSDGRRIKKLVERIMKKFTQ